MSKICLFNRVNFLILVNILILFFCFENNVYAEFKSITFNNLNVEHGVSQSTIDAIFQDSKGYIWIGTNDGLNKYNGYEFKIYTYDEDKNSISNNYITDIDEDSNGDIWIATIDGLNKLNTSTEEITNYTEDKGLISSNNITDIILSEDGKIIVATANGLNVYNKETNRFDRVLEKDTELISQFIYSIDEDSEENLWIGTNKGISKVSKNFKLIKNYPIGDEKNFIGNSDIYNVYCDDEKNEVWFGTLSSGLYKMNIKTDKITGYFSNVDEPNSIPSSSIGAITKDSKGNIWIGTAKGLAKYNEKEDNFYIYSNKLYDKNSLVNDNVKSLMEDSEGLIWVGTYSGISVFDVDSKINHYKAGTDKEYLLNENIVHGIYEDEEGYLWVGTNSKGVNIIDRENNKSDYINKTTNKNFINDSINDITGKGNIVYIATDGGLIKFDKFKKVMSSYTKKDGLINDHIKDIMIDSKGYLWMGTSDGVCILDMKTDEIIDINKYINNGKKENKYVRYVFEDSEGNYFLGFLREEGLCKIDVKNKTITYYKNDKKNKNSISNNYIRYINEDSKGNIWIGTSYGLNKFDKKTEKFKRYTTNDGIANNTVYGVLVDNDDNVWISTNKGISKINTTNGKIQNLSVTDGLQGNEFNGNSAYKNKKGEFFFGGVNGLNSFSPDKVIKSGEKPNLLFDKFIINNKEYNNIDKLKFSEKIDTITIKFFVPKYSSKRSTIYEYHLDGTSGDVVRTKDNYVTYNDLAPGKYTFKIRAIDKNGNISDENSVDFTIKPPFWMSWYAYFIYAFIIIILIINHKYKVKKLDKLVQNRTLRLREEMERNTILLNKNIKLEKNKNSYFVNLSHELRTPLNVISSTNQLILELMKKDGGIKSQSLNHHIDVSQRNCKRLLNLINNIVDTTKLQNDMYVISLKETDIVYLVEETALTLVDYVKSKGIELIIDPEIEEKAIMCDSYEIERCIVNLVGNAVKFTPKGGTITITIKDLNDRVKISVLDTGVGIDEKHHKIIFDRFSQVIDLNNEVKGGSGLGLTITNYIVKLHNGEIYVESELGKGSEFIIILPVNPNIEEKK